MNQYLLEKSRIVRRPAANPPAPPAARPRAQPPPRSPPPAAPPADHVRRGRAELPAFYIVAGTDKGEQGRLGVGDEPTKFRYLNQSSVTAMPQMPDDKMYAELAGALTTCGVSADEQTNLRAVVAGVLNIGNIDFTGDDNEGVDGELAHKGESCWGRTRGLLGAALAQGRLRGDDGAAQRAERRLRRDAVCKAVYMRSSGSSAR